MGRHSLIQITDTHLTKDTDGNHLGIPALAALELVLADIKTKYPDAEAFLLTGDLAQDAEPQSYVWLQESLRRFSTPIYAIPGNHDDTVAMTQSLVGDHIQVDQGFDCGQWRVITLNSVVTGKEYGWIAERELQRLRQELSTDKHKWVLIAMHHPPVKIGSEWMDRMGLRNGDELLQLVGQHPQVKVMVWGHAHQEYHAQLGECVLLGAPSTCIQFMPKAAGFEVDPQTPGYRVLHLFDDGRFDTKVERLKNFPYRANPVIGNY